MSLSGRVTLPIEHGIDDAVRDLMERLGADAVRNSDGTELPELVHELAAKVYSTYFPARGSQEWALAHPDTTTHLFLQSPRVTAPAWAGQTPRLAQADAGKSADQADSAGVDQGGVESPLRIDVMSGYLTEQIQPDTQVDLGRYWQVIDRTTGRTLSPEEWSLSGEQYVTIAQPTPGHVYTVDFLARQVWDSTQIYNYLTNNWEEDPTRVKERPYDARLPEVWDFVRVELGSWLQEHPEVDVVRFTTFFYHFTLVFNQNRKEKYVDWFGYSASVSVEALEAFAAEYGYELTPEDFVDEGYYNSPFRVPTQHFKDWVDFQHRFVISRVRELTDQVHAAGKEAMMFLGDTWIGTEPYGPHFPEAGLDAVVGSVGNAATCRLISDIPGVRYTEGRFLPYFFPDVFTEGGDPVGEANQSWLAARRAIVRSPLDRIGYGGYLSLALTFPEFIDRITHICDEFREIYAATGGRSPLSAPVRVAVLNAWGKLRSWQTHMVAHALPYEQTEPYIGVLESLAGLDVDVSFLSFEEVLEGVPEDIDVILNVGQAGTAYSGGVWWTRPELQVAIRRFVARGGGFVGIGDPTAYPANGVFFQLADVMGVDKEQSFSLSTDRYYAVSSEHFITENLALDVTGGARFTVPVTEDVQVLAARRSSSDPAVHTSGSAQASTTSDAAARAGSIDAAVHPYGKGRSVYLSGLPYTAENARILQRALFWVAGKEAEYERLPHAIDARVEVARYEDGRVFVYNSSFDHVNTQLVGEELKRPVSLEPLGAEWI